MPTLDVTEVLSSPEFQTSFIVKSRTITVDTQGMASLGLSPPVTAYGVVVPASGSLLVRNPEGEMVVGDINVISMFLLSTGAGASDADIVTWKGVDYVVINIDDYSEFGAGFMRATCKQLRLNI